ncbi:HIT family protein [Tuwongella immobilis]|uniref:HIT domain-containing protein n=1 Tax=Tuwongella immobilis TaxID=692036 RepID=A0A6C2YJY8_9BACT|nr:HIT family protein [Tuwongella immobilis]VIP01736.1 histidine triad protein : HIT domain protein OS=Streptococcus mitis SK321 GN=SMSK321_0104 PE=4 SV=1: HIT [Tuwongella immobilis]VTR99296.1 histidine triad protein : HIT domain protein OS=Streptococcus mitis SK321 GN=SMSK321_0104 PE=4 SV=1: HIT [Tuwongella immobilis]
MAEADCPLCQAIAAGYAADTLVWEFPHSLAILGPWQYYHGYCVLISKTHARELNRLPAKVRRDYLEEMSVLADAVESAFAPRKLNIESLGNVVPHLHWHLFPRYETDADHLKAVWLALDAAERDPARKTALQTGLTPREVTIARLQAALRERIGS